MQSDEPRDLPDYVASLMTESSDDADDSAADSNQLSAADEGKFPGGVVCRGPPVRTFKIWLPMTAEVFGSMTQHWCREYQPARKIFEGGELLMTLVCKAHDVLFKSKTPPQRLQNGAALREMIGADAKMTFSLTDKYLYIGDTGLGPKDWLSKHVLLSRAAVEVRCAGSLGFEEEILMICNDSGTYRPCEDALKLFKELLLRSFADIQVVMRVVKADADEKEGENKVKIV